MAEITNDLKSILSIDNLSQAELIRAIRVSIKAEIDAVHLYMMIAEATDNEDVKKIMEETAKEERVHIGEFLKALQLVAPGEFADYNDGAEEVEHLLGHNPGPSNPGGPPSTPSMPSAPPSFEDRLAGMGSKLDEVLKSK